MHFTSRARSAPCGDSDAVPTPNASRHPFASFFVRRYGPIGAGGPNGRFARRMASPARIRQLYRCHFERRSSCRPHGNAAPAGASQRHQHAHRQGRRFRLFRDGVPRRTQQSHRDSDGLVRARADCRSEAARTDSRTRRVSHRARADDASERLHDRIDGDAKQRGSRWERGCHSGRSGDRSRRSWQGCWHCSACHGHRRSCRRLRRPFGGQPIEGKSRHWTRRRCRRRFAGSFTHARSGSGAAARHHLGCRPRPRATAGRQSFAAE